MADEKLSWAFQLIDKMSAPALKMEKALLRVSKTLEDGSKATVMFTRNMNAASKEGGELKNIFGGFGGPLGVFVGGAQMVTSVLTDIAFSFGTAALKAMAFKESTVTSFKAMTGSAAKANELFKRSVVLADITPFGTKDVVQQVRGIMGAGFKQKEAENLFAALSDVASISGGGADAIQGMLTQISQAKGVGKFQLGDLKIIMAYAGQAGVSLEKLYEQLAKQEKMDKTMVPGALGSGQIGFDSGLNAIMEVIERDISGGKLGTRTLEQGLSLSGLFSTLESLPEKALLSLNTEGAGSKGLRTFLDTTISTINASVSEGGRINKLLQSVSDDFGVWLGRLVADGTLDRFINALTIGLEGGYKFFGYLVEAGRAFWKELEPAITGSETFKQIFGEAGRSGVENFGAAMGFVAIMIGKAAAAIVAIADVPLRLMEGVKQIREWEITMLQEGVSIGKAIVDGIINGITLGLGGGALKSALAALAKAAPESVKTALDIKSPSRVMELLGEQTVAGFQQGLNTPVDSAAMARGAADVRTAELQDRIAKRQPDARAGGNTVNMTVTVPVTVHAGQADAEGVARHLEEQLSTQLSLLFRRLALEVGQ